MLPCKNKIVYVHKLNNNIVYVGQGNVNRVISKTGRSPEHLSAWENLDKVIIHSDLDKDEASQIEYNLISTLTSSGVHLFNIVKYKTTVKPVIYQVISEILEYDEMSSTGLRWRVDKSRRCKIGSEAGYLSKSDGYIKLTIDGKLYMGHRIIYCLLTGKDLDAALVIDHIDRNRLNNTLDNLREVSNEINCRNRKYLPNTTTGEQYIGEQPHYYRFVVRWTSENHRHTKCFSYNPNQRKTGFANMDYAFIAAIEFRNKLVTQNIITLVGN